MVTNFTQLNKILAAPIKTQLKLWLKLDTGMHRLGFAPQDYSRAYWQLKASDKVHDDMVLVTHFACADERDKATTQHQIEQFYTLTNSLSGPCSLGNSAGILGWEQGRGDWVRPGLMLYGASPFRDTNGHAYDLKPAMTLSSSIIDLRSIQAGEAVGYGGDWVAQRPSKIATVAVGYADGYPRQAPAGTPVAISGQRAPLVGRVSMDMITVDVTDLPQVALYDKVELWGAQVPINTVSKQANTIANELLSRMPSRVPRVYRV